jgi:hypothetical protein
MDGFIRHVEHSTRFGDRNGDILVTAGVSASLMPFVNAFDLTIGVVALGLSSRPMKL